MPKPRYFLDANVIISGLLWKGNEMKLLEYGEEGKRALITSLYVIKEIEDVLRRMKFEDNKVEEFIVFIRSFIELIDVHPNDIMEYWDVLKDKTDVPVLVAAIKSKSILVTGDRELSEKGIKFIKVKNTKQALE